MSIQPLVDSNCKSPSAKMLSSETCMSLEMLIVGFGVGDLAGAIALRQRGHQVKLFEQSRFAD